MKIHIIAICGSATSALAGLLKDQGHIVSGSDTGFYPPMSNVLKKLKIKIYKSYSEKNISKDIDLVVIGNAVGINNEEVQYALNNNFKVLSFADALDKFFLEKSYSVVVTGTHGKTTTSSLISYIFDYGKKHPGFLIGGVPVNFNRNYNSGNGKYFIVEGDEYNSSCLIKEKNNDPKFYHYSVNMGIINNIEFDHKDIYNNLDEIKNVFYNFAKKTLRKGYLIVNNDDKNIKEILSKIRYNKKKILRYGKNKDAYIWFKNLQYKDRKMFFDIIINNKKYKVETELAGRHNVYNILAGFLAGYINGIKPEIILDAIKRFNGVKKRMEVKYNKNNCYIIDDFAHHPTAVRTTLEAVRKKYEGYKIICIFEPSSYTSMTNKFQNRYKYCFDIADKIYLAPVLKKDKIKKENRLDVKKLCLDLKNRGERAVFFNSKEKLLEEVKKEITPMNVIINFSTRYLFRDGPKNGCCGLITY